MKWGLLLLCAVLAGCASGGSTQEPAQQEPGPDNDLPPELQYQPGYKSKTGGYVNGTDAAYYCDTIADSTVQVDANKTFDGGAHSHDMWKGQDSMVIFEANIEDFIEQTSRGSSGVGIAGTWFSTPGAVVHPGAGKATFKLEWDTDAADARELGVDLPILKRDSVDRFTDYVLKFTESGQEHSVNFTFADNDPAHAERTFWKFKLHHGNTVTDAAGRDDVKDIVYQTAFGALRESKLTWTIHRTYDCLPVDPPHYDFWNDTVETTVFEAKREYAVTRAVVTGVGAASGFQAGCPEGCGLPDNGTVPPGTGTVRVTMTWDNADNVPAKPGLEFVAADQNPISQEAVWARPRPAEDGANERVYIIDVHPLQTDSPYAEKSRWDFRWYFDELGHDSVDNAGKFTGTIEWKVEAFKAGYEP